MSADQVYALPIPRFQVYALPNFDFRCMHFRILISGVCTSEIRFQMYALPTRTDVCTSVNFRQPSFQEIVYTSMRLHTQVCALYEVHTSVKHASEVHTIFLYSMHFRQLIQEIVYTSGPFYPSVFTSMIILPNVCTTDNISRSCSIKS